MAKSDYGGTACVLYTIISGYMYVCSGQYIPFVMA